MALQIIRNNIINVEADAIVNTANPKVAVGRGVDLAIYEAAGYEKLLEARAEIGEMEPGQAAFTPAFDLRAKYIIHTVGPAWRGGSFGEREAVAACYRNSLELAKKLECESIAFPLIATGTYGFPKDEALRIAIAVISGFLLANEMEVLLVVYDKESFRVSGKLFSGIRMYIGDSDVREMSVCEAPRRGGLSGSNRGRVSYGSSKGSPSYSSTSDHYPAKRKRRRRRLFDRLAREEAPAKEETLEEIPVKKEALEETAAGEPKELKEPEASKAPKAQDEQRVLYAEEASVMAEESGYYEGAICSDLEEKAYAEDIADEAAESFPSKERSLDERIEHMDKTFQEYLFMLIDRRGLTDPEVYRKANIDRKHFSKIRSNPDYKPSKRTALALALALELSLDETKDLLARAGLALSPSIIFDIIIEYCIRTRNYNIYDINCILFQYDQPTLGA